MKKPASDTDFKGYKANSSRSLNTIKKLEEKLAQKCSCGKDFIIVHLQKIENTLYKSSYEFFKSGETPILILDDEGLHEIEKESPIFGSQEPLLKLYVFCPEENKIQIRDCAKDILL